MRFQRQCNTLPAYEKQQIIRLFSALEYGEQLAHQCAREQAQLVDNKRQGRFLTRQSYHEAFHAKFFHKAAQYLGRSKSCPPPNSLQLFSNKLKHALQRKDLTETLVGQQMVLEVFGAAILHHLNRGLDNHGIGLKKLRALVLQQEQGHHDFGDDLLRKQLLEGETTIETIQSLSSEYLLLAHAIIDEMSDVFYCLDEAPEEYKHHVVSSLPEWLILPSA